MNVKYVAVIAGASFMVLDKLVLFTRGRVSLDALLLASVGWLEWTFLAPAVVWVATAVPYRPARRLRFFLVHTCAAASIAFVHMAVYVVLRTIIHGPPGRPGQPIQSADAVARLLFHDTPTVLIDAMQVDLLLQLLVYAGTVLATHLDAYLKASRKREEERFALERWLAKAELDRYALELPAGEMNERLLQIEHTIGSDVEKAELLIEEFSAALRKSLAAASIHAEPDEVAYDEREMEQEEEQFPRELTMPLRLALLFSIIPAVQVFSGTLFSAAAVARGQTLSWAPWLRALLASIEFFPLTLGMVWLGSHVRRVAVIALAAAVLPFAWHTTVVTALDAAGISPKQLAQPGGIMSFLLFLGIALGAVAHRRYRTWRTAAQQVAQLESNILRTRATLLRLQLQPHFLFNSLNSVAALLEDDARAASRMAAQLRHFVVRVLESSDREQVPLAEELDSLGSYVAIENVRFAGRVELDVRTDDDSRRALVPNFLLQPIVENALRHGLMPEGGGRVSVRASVRDATLHIAVDDNGSGNHGELPAREGLGLSTTRARLANSYGDEFTFAVSPRPDSFGVAIELPYRIACESALSRLHP
jgi:two-component system, LytTR family, sensor kinase